MSKWEGSQGQGQIPALMGLSQGRWSRLWAKVRVEVG